MSRIPFISLLLLLSACSSEKEKAAEEPAKPKDEKSLSQTMAVTPTWSVRLEYDVDLDEVVELELRTLATRILVALEEADVAGGVKVGNRGQGPELQFQRSMPGLEELVTEEFLKEFDPRFELREGPAALLCLGATAATTQFYRNDLSRRSVEVIGKRLREYGFIGAKVVAEGPRVVVTVDVVPAGKLELLRYLVETVGRVALRVVDSEANFFALTRPLLDEYLKHRPWDAEVLRLRPSGASTELYSSSREALESYVGWLTKRGSVPLNRAIGIEAVLTTGDSTVGPSPLWRAEYVHFVPGLTGDQVTKAVVHKDEALGYVVNLSFSGEGAKALGLLTEAIVGRKLAIMLDNEVLSAPVVREAITGGKAMVYMGGFGSGEAEEARAKRIASLITSGRSGSALKLVSLESDRSGRVPEEARTRLLLRFAREPSVDQAALRFAARSAVAHLAGGSLEPKCNVHEYPLGEQTVATWEVETELVHTMSQDQCAAVLEALKKAMPHAESVVQTQCGSWSVGLKRPVPAGETRLTLELALSELKVPGLSVEAREDAEFRQAYRRDTAWAQASLWSMAVAEESSREIMTKRIEAFYSKGEAAVFTVKADPLQQAIEDRIKADDKLAPTWLGFVR